MTTLTSPSATPTESAPPRIPLNLFVAYDDLESGRQAMELVQRLRGSTQDDTDLVSVFWRIDILTHDSPHRAAVDDARRADIFVVGLSRANSLSRLSAWLHQALMSRHGDYTAVVAAVPDGFDREPEGERSLSTLAGIAARFGATFLSTGPRQPHPWAADAVHRPLLTA